MNIKRVIGGCLLSVAFLVFFISFVVGAQWILKIAIGDGVSTAALSGLFSGVVPVANSDKTTLADESNVGQAPSKNQQVEELDIQAKSAISMWTNISGGSEIVFEKNSQENLPIASISKLMTALIVAENLDISKEIKISSIAAHQSNDPESLKEEETFYVKDLLYTMLIGSDNAASYAFAESIGVDEFVNLMNKKAEELGLSDTIFSNPTGLGPENISTAQDVVKLAVYILKNYPFIFGITTKPEFDLRTVNGKTIYKITSTDKLLSDSSNLSGRIMGGKTGETPFAGECLVSVVKPLGEQGYLINVVLNANNRFEETKKMINWVDKSYQWETINKAKIAELPQISKAFNPDNLTWEEAVSSAPWEERDSHTVVVYNNKIWLMGGLNANGHMASLGDVDYNSATYPGDVWSSDDGASWQLVANSVPWGKRRSVGLVNFKGKIWMMGGYSPDYGYRNDVWSTADGINWEQESTSVAWSAREGQDLLVFQDKIWLIGGVKYDKNVSAASSEKSELFNDVWYSSDGINWIEATAHAAWAPRWDMAMGVFDNKLWLVDGMVFGGKMFRDVWYSSDGTNWILVTDSPPFRARQGNFLTEYKGKMWIIGRLDGVNGGANDVWYSADGANWQKTKTDPAWFGREDFGAVVFKDKVWVLGGMDKNWEWVNDIWYSTF